MSKITGIGIALLLVICVPKILSFYDISLSAYGPYLAFLIFIVILAFILPHNFLVTVDTVADVAKNISERSDASATNATSSANTEGLGVEKISNSQGQGETINLSNENERAGQGRTRGTNETISYTNNSNNSNNNNSNNSNNNYQTGMSDADLRDFYGSYNRI